MLTEKSIESIVWQDKFSDHVCLQIANNSVSEAILDGLLTNKERFGDFAKAYDMSLKK